MYHRRCFSDGCIVTRQGSLKFHQALIATRCAPVWELLLELADLQDQSGLQKQLASSSSDDTRHTSGFTLHLPDVQHCAIQHFLVSLYSNSDIVELRTIHKGVRERIEWLRQLCELKRRRIPLQPLDRSDSEHVQQQILHQLREQQGTRPFHPTTKDTSLQGRKSPTESDLSCVLSRSPPPNIVTFESLRKKQSSTASNANVPSQSISSESCVSLTVNYNKPKQLVKKTSLPINSQSSIQVVDLNTYLHSYENGNKCRKRSNTVSRIHVSKRPRLKFSSASQKHTSDPFESPLTLRRRYNSESIHHRMKMDEFGTDDHRPIISFKSDDRAAMTDAAEEMFVVGEAGAGAAQDDRNTSCPAREDITDAKPENNDNFNVIGDRRSSDPELQDPELEVFPSVRAQVKRLESFNHNSSSSKDNTYERSQSSFELNPRSMSLNENSNGNGLEASSLDVDLEICNEINPKSGSSNVVDPPHLASSKPETNASESNVSSHKDEVGNYVHKPLVRTRTFEIIERYVNTNDSTGVKDSVKTENVNSDSVPIPQNRNTSHSIHRVPSLRTSREAQLVMQPQEVLTLDSLRELERKQGSLLFEHNFPTFSNIPTTNMMTATMMTGSVSSESSLGLGSMFSSIADNSSVVASSHSDSMSSYSTSLHGDIVEHVKIVPTPLPRNFLRSIDSSRSIESNETSREQKTLSKLSDNSSRSASPDSLCVDQFRKSIMNHDCPETDSLMSGKINPTHSYESSTSGKKEDFDDEVKEQDDLESKDDSEVTLKYDSIPVEAAKPFFQVSSGISSLTGSPRVQRRAEHTPILSGGSTLKRELSSDGKNSVENRFDRQVSTTSVKDVDSIPLVCGFVETDTKSQYVDDQSKPDSQPQSIFSMFIDFNELPSPAKETRPLPVTNENKPQSVYMFIEAEAAPSPKIRRKSKLESDSIPGSNISRSSIEDIETPPLSLPKNPLNDIVLNGKEDDVNISKIDLDDDKETDKKGFFMFIEAETHSTKGSPRLRRKPILMPKKSSNDSCSSVMSKSAPSDVLLMATKPQLSEKLCSKPIVNGDELMTKSVIDRKEYMEQPVTKRNVSLNDKINESPSSSLKNIRDGFISGIPRPIHLLKSKSCSKVSPTE